MKFEPIFKKVRRRKIQLICAAQLLTDYISVADPFHFDTAPDPDPRIYFVETDPGPNQIQNPHFIFFSSDYLKNGSGSATLEYTNH